MKDISILEDREKIQNLLKYIMNIFEIKHNLRYYIRIMLLMSIQAVTYRMMKRIIVQAFRKYLNTTRIIVKNNINLNNKWCFPNRLRVGINLQVVMRSVKNK